MAATTTKDEEEKWDVFYSEKKFPSYEKMLLIKLLKDDFSNESFLADKYEEADLPADPVSILLDQARTNLVQAAAAQDPSYTLPTKLDVLNDPRAVLDKFVKFIDSQGNSNGCTNNRVANLKANVKKHKTDEFIMYKKIARSLVKHPLLLDETNLAAGRALLRFLRDKNALNHTQAQANEQINQFWKFRLRK